MMPEGSPHTSWGSKLRQIGYQKFYFLVKVRRGESEKVSNSVLASHFHTFFFLRSPRLCGEIL